MLRTKILLLIIPFITVVTAQNWKTESPFGRIPSRFTFRPENRLETYHTTPAHAPTTTTSKPPITTPTVPSTTTSTKGNDESSNVPSTGRRLFPNYSHPNRGSFFFRPTPRPVQRPVVTTSKPTVTVVVLPGQHSGLTTPTPTPYTIVYPQTFRPFSKPALNQAPSKPAFHLTAESEPVEINSYPKQEPQPEPLQESIAPKPEVTTQVVSQPTSESNQEIVETSSVQPELVQEVKPTSLSQPEDIVIEPTKAPQSETPIPESVSESAQTSQPDNEQSPETEETAQHDVDITPKPQEEVPNEESKPELEASNQPESNIVAEPHPLPLSQPNEQEIPQPEQNVEPESNDATALPEQSSPLPLITSSTSPSQPESVSEQGVPEPETNPVASSISATSSEPPVISTVSSNPEPEPELNSEAPSTPVTSSELPPTSNVSPNSQPEPEWNSESPSTPVTSSEPPAIPIVSSNPEPEENLQPQPNIDTSEPEISDISPKTPQLRNQYQHGTRVGKKASVPSHPNPWMPGTAKPLPILPSRTTTTTSSPVIVYPDVNPVTKYSENHRSYSALSDYTCAESNGYYSVANQCDAFIECKANTAIQILCPDGLVFSPNAIWPEYPCVYPNQVKCSSQALRQTPRPTANCPRQNGYFSSSSGDCGKYVICQEGKATSMSCPPGLGFNFQTSSCDWPANIPECSPNAFEGFTCPAATLDDGKPSDFINKFRQGKSCSNYIACQRGSPRLLSCDEGLSFDEESQSCIDSDSVTDCSE